MFKQDYNYLDSFVLIGACLILYIEILYFALIMDGKYFFIQYIVSYQISDDTIFLQAFIGPYWSLRAAMGPILETLILLDRLLFFQEQESLVEAFMLPIFDPALSPRNVAIIATKVNTEMIN